MSIENQTIAIGESLRRLVKTLCARGYRFAHPARVLPGPQRDTSAAIARIEREIGTVPLALKIFWQKVGSVDLCGSHPDWKGAFYPDPLVIFPPEIALGNLNDFLADREANLEEGIPYLIPIAPDFYHKEDVSGGMYYNVAFPADDDPLLNDEWHSTTLLGYLELALKSGGFPGVQRYPDHTWPIVDLVNEIYETS